MQRTPVLPLIINPGGLITVSYRAEDISRDIITNMQDLLRTQFQLRRHQTEHIRCRFHFPAVTGFEYMLEVAIQPDTFQQYIAIGNDDQWEMAAELLQYLN